VTDGSCLLTAGNIFVKKFVTQLTRTFVIYKNI